MSNLENEFITMVNEDGNEELFRIIRTIESDEFDKTYMLIVSAEEPADEDEEVEVFAYAYTTKEDGSIDELFPVETDEEWDMIEEVFLATEGLDEEDFDQDDE